MTFIFIRSLFPALRLSTPALVVSLCAGTARAMLSLGDITTWVGSGSNSAGFVIDWNDGSTDSSMLWGYHWNGTATGEQMLDAVVAADPHLYVLLSAATARQTSVFGFGYDQNVTGSFALSPPLSFTNQIATTNFAGVDDARTPVNSTDRWQEGWYTAGYWAYWTSTSSQLATNSSDWNLSGQGMSSRALTDGDWDGWSFARKFDAVPPAPPVLSPYSSRPGLTIAANSTVTATETLFVSTLTLAGGTGDWTGKLDLGNHDLDVQQGNVDQITNEVAQGYDGGSWNSSGGIVSSAAAADSTHLTALGVMPNSNGTGGVIYSTFDGQPVSTTDVLVKYTYYGDANLDGVVDGSDYSLIDNGFLTHATGWFNGDFNYDGVIDGSDYTLIDNAFDRQGASVAWEPASTTALIAVNAGDTDVPEPPGFFLLVVAYAAMLRLERTNALQAALDP